MSCARLSLDRALLFALAGTMTLLAIVLAVTVGPWFLLLGAFVAAQPVAVRAGRRLPGVGRPRPDALLPERGDPVSTVAASAATRHRSARSVGSAGGRPAHVRLVVVVWALVAAGLGALAPRAEHALSGAGWEASGSESVAAREAIDGAFGGQGGYALMVVVHGAGNLDPTVAERDAGSSRPTSVSRPSLRRRSPGTAAP